MSRIHFWVFPEWAVKRLYEYMLYVSMLNVVYIR